MFLQYFYLLIKGLTMYGQHFHSLIKAKVAFCPQFGITLYIPKFVSLENSPMEYSKKITSYLLT